MNAARKSILAKRLRAAREATFSSQADVTRALAWHPTTLTKIEKGRRSVQALELAELARQYGVTLVSLLEGL